MRIYQWHTLRLIPKYAFKTTFYRKSFRLDTEDLRLIISPIKAK